MLRVRLILVLRKQLDGQSGQPCLTQTPSSLRPVYQCWDSIKVRQGKTPALGLIYGATIGLADGYAFISWANFVRGLLSQMERHSMEKCTTNRVPF